jgi:hypothetical protein
MSEKYYNKGISVIKENRFITIVVLLILMVISCVTPFVPEYNGEENLLVVEASLIKGNKTQVIKISRSSSINLPKSQYFQLNPVSNCQVKIVDDSGTEFAFTDKSNGRYEAVIDDAQLSYDTQYKLQITTPTGENYESGYEGIVETAPVDSIYYITENQYNTLLNDYSIEGAQFYIDLDAPDDASQYYRWQIEETWEVHSVNKISGVYDGKSVKVVVWPSDSLFYCWKTKLANGIYTSSTVALSHNNIKQIPLHFKEKSSPELGIKYCATVRQYALSKDAYDYWSQKESELFESDQLYTSQPNQVKSNIFNTKDPEEIVLGYFWVSSCTLKRIFLEHPFGAGGEEPDICKTLTVCTDQLGAELEKTLLNSINYYKSRYSDFPKPPVYIYFTNPNCYNIAKTRYCIDCRLMSAYTPATTKKPDFWQ